MCTNGSQPEVHVKENLLTTSSSNASGTTSKINWKYKISEVDDRGIEKCVLVDLEAVVETDL